jgi:hypothetical protein
MPIQSLSALSPESRLAAETYLRAVAAALRGADAEMRDDIVADLESHLLESLDAAATADEVAAVIAELGAPESFSAELGSETEAPRTAGAGRVLGMPYDWRVPTGARVAERLWNPRDPRIWMPRIFGVGWSINFGAIAVRLNLIEPDSEDVPFTSTPRAAFLVALAVPIALTSAMLVSYLALRNALPEQLPSHWNLQGVADGFSSQEFAFGFLFVMALIPTLIAVQSVMRRRPALSLGATIGLAGLFAGLGSLLWLLTLITVLTEFVAWWLPPLLICLALFVPFGILLLLARAGRKAEQQRDFAKAR